MMAEPGFADLSLEEQNLVTRQAVACQTLVIYRTMADPALTDLSIHPNKRAILGLMQPDPQVANWSIPGFVQMMTAEGWLSTWSGLSTQVNMHRDARKVTQPVLSISFSADVTILPFVAKGLYENVASSDRTYVEVEGDHFGFRDVGEREGGVIDAAASIVAWLTPRFPKAEVAA